MKTANQQLGFLGEKIVFNILQIGGLCPRFTEPCSKQGDLTFKHEGKTVRVEVKTSNYSAKYERWKVCLEKKGFTSCKHSDFIVVVLMSAIGVAHLMVIPCSAITTKNLTIRKEAFTSKWSRYIVRSNEVLKCLGV